MLLPSLEILDHPFGWECTFHEFMLVKLWQTNKNLSENEFNQEHLSMIADEILKLGQVSAKWLWL